MSSENAAGSPGPPASGASTLNALVRRVSPDLNATLQRFPLAVLFAALGTLIFIAGVNEWLGGSDEFWMRAFLGAATASLVATAGSLYREERPERRLSSIALGWVLPVLVMTALQVRTHVWLAAEILPLAAVFWASVAGVTRFGSGEGRETQQDRFWWLNNRAVTAAALAVLGALVFGLGMLAIQRSVDLLFGIDLTDLLFKWVLPVIGFFCAPLYWLSVLPRVNEFTPGEIEHPDFVSLAIGFLGQFVLTPLLLVYALILLAYAVQIIVTQTLPVGVLGWLVLSYVVIGAANWLLLHPRFMRTRRVAAVFRASWFWLTLVPLAMFAFALYVRVEAYGWTPERLLLAGGGIWAALLALAFLLRRGRGDIRLIPALAGVVLLLLGVGPWNLYNLSLQDQTTRFETALAAAAQPGGGFDWGRQTAQQASGALGYLSADDEAEPRLVEILAAYDIDLTPSQFGYGAIAGLLDLPEVSGQPNTYVTSLGRRLDLAVSVDGTPIMLGEVSAFAEPVNRQDGAVELRIVGEQLVVTDRSQKGLQTEVALAGWLAEQTDNEVVTQPALDFTVGERRFRLIVNHAQMDSSYGGDAPQVTHLFGLLFSDSQ